MPAAERGATPSVAPSWRDRPPVALVGPDRRGPGGGRGFGATCGTAGRARPGWLPACLVVAGLALGPAAWAVPTPMPAVTAVAPGVGAPGGGTPVMITGTGFDAGPQVYFGAVAATSVAVLSATRIVAVAPSGAGTVDVTVRTANGTSAAGSVDRFTFSRAARACAPAFTDVPPDYWAAAPIYALQCAGIVSGLPDGAFLPDQAVTRAEFVKMLDRVLGLKPAPAVLPFADVPPAAWFAPYVAAAVHAGVVQGLAPTTFGPEATLTREEMAVLLARALHLSTIGAPSFGDSAEISAWAGPGVDAAVAAGYLDGFPDGDFQPLGTATRAQAAKVLAIAIP